MHRQTLKADNVFDIMQIRQQNFIMEIEVLRFYKTKTLSIKLLRIGNNYRVIEEGYDSIVIIDKEYQLFSIALSQFKDLVLYFL